MDRSHFPASRNKRRAVRLFTCSAFMLHASVLPLCCCLQTVALVLVAWCRTFHERSLCLLRRVLVKSCPVVAYSCSSGTPQPLLSLLFFSRPPTPETYLESGLGAATIQLAVQPLRPLQYSLLVRLHYTCGFSLYASVFYDTGFS